MVSNFIKNASMGTIQDVNQVVAYTIVCQNSASGF